MGQLVRLHRLNATSNSKIEQGKLNNLNKIEKGNPSFPLLWCIFTLKKKYSTLRTNEIIYRDDSSCFCYS